MKSARPSLSSLVAKKAGQQPVVAPEAAPSEPAAAPDRVGVIVRLTAAERKSLRRIALEGDTTVQALVEQAVRDIIRRHEG